TEGFIRALSLNNAEAAFFTDLVQLDQAKTAAEKNDALERVAASQRFRSARPISGAMVRYLSSWYYPALRELAHREGFVADPEWVCCQLHPAITAAQARDALQTLFELGMLVEEGGRVRPAEVSVATPHEVAGLVAHNYHRQMLDRARGAIEGAEPEERHLLGITVAIPESLVSRLKVELDEFQERLLHLCDQHVAEAERVYQLNLHLFPLSKALGGP
ncbi:MAG: TIGR02147 family protein, partial [Deltaproteobacteria bacterium]|nr:TIGR02147 family protein [Deltaproteobacteria bacterium]